MEPFAAPTLWNCTARLHPPRNRLEPYDPRQESDICEYRTKPECPFRLSRSSLPNARSHVLGIESDQRRPLTSLRRRHPCHAPLGSFVNTGNLYLLLGSRPPSRAFAQIPYRRISWSRNNLVAGRGASRRLLERYHTTSVCSSAQETSNYVPWPCIRSLPSHLARGPGPLAVRPIGKKGSDAPSKRVPSFVPATEKESLAQSTKRTPKNEQAQTQAASVAPAEQGRPVELDRIRSKVALWDSEERQAHAPARPVIDTPVFKPSDQVHVMGLDLTGRYIAHTLAGCRTIPPVRYMLHRHYLYRQWHQTEKQLTMYRGDKSIVHRRVIAERISDEDAELEIGDVVDNLVVTLPASQVVQAIGHIRHRLDHRSTICLINDGLGVAEALIEAYFPDESRRPVFLLGHFTTSLGHTDSRFSVSEVRPGRLYLSLFSPPRLEAGQRFRIKRHPPLERTARAMHFIRLLSAMPGLNATGHSMSEFLRYKLPTVAFRTIVDPLAALLDCRYDYLPTNPYARQLMDRLVGELARVVSLLPECKNSQKFRQVDFSSSLRDEVFHKLVRQRTADSKMRTQVGRGWDTDVDFLSGYFVRRGREVHATVTTLDSMMWAVKAKQVVVMKKLGLDIPYEAAQSGGR